MSNKLTLIGEFVEAEGLTLVVTFVAPLAVYVHQGNIVVSLSDKSTFVAKCSDHVSTLSTNERAFREWLKD